MIGNTVDGLAVVVLAMVVGGIALLVYGRVMRVRHRRRMEAMARGVAERR